MYDALKAFPKLVRKLSQGKPFFKVKAGGTITQSVPNIHFTIGKMHAVLPMETDDEKYEYFVDKMFEFASNQQVSEMSYLILDDTTGDMQLLTREQFLEKIRNEHVIK